MPNINQIETRVNALNNNTSSDDSFIDVFGLIEDAGDEVGNGEIDRLRDILSRFRSKIPNLVTLKRTRADARDLANELALNTLQLRINRINKRNEKLAALSQKLVVLNGQIQDDAGLLGRIQDAIDKATKTVNEVKSLVDQLQASNSIKSDLKALIDAVDGISSIFKPQQT